MLIITVCHFKGNEAKKNVSSKLFLMCQMVVSDNDLGNFDDGTA